MSNHQNARQQAKEAARQAHAEKMARKRLERTAATQSVAVLTNALGDVDRSAVGGLVWYVEERAADGRIPIRYDVHTMNDAGQHLCAGTSLGVDGRWEWGIYAYTDTGPDSEADESIEEGRGMKTPQAAFAAAEAALARAGWTREAFRQEKV